MASHARKKNTSVIEELFEHPGQFSFFQAVRILRLYAKKSKGINSRQFYRDFLRVRPQLSLGFPATEITSLERKEVDEEIAYKLETTFLGLYGVSSPLPVFYTEELLIERSDDKCVTRDFVDIINNNLYTQFFKAWNRSRLMIRTVEEKDAEWLDRLYCLLGYGHQAIRDVLSEECLQFRHIGLYSQYPRSALGLETLLRDSLNHLDLHVEQCALRKVNLPEDQLCLLGVSTNLLGEEAWIGQELDDLAGKITILIGNLPAAKYRELLPGEKGAKMLDNLVQAYIVEPLHYDLVLEMKEGEIHTTTLGERNWGALGCDTWLFSGEKNDASGVVFPYERFIGEKKT
ncbi:MAG: type VI secretion system baseplate subunit TssG [Desulfotalea sp.]